MSIPVRYSEILKKKGRPLHDIGINEIALSKADALEAIKSLRLSQMAILGGDVLEIVDGKPKHTYDNWYYNREETEERNVYLKNPEIRQKHRLLNIMKLQIQKLCIC